LHAICISLVAVLAYVVKNSDLSEYKERLVAIRWNILAILTWLLVPSHHCCGSGAFLALDPGSGIRFFRIPDPKHIFLIA
jgi:hypothetical protein